MERERRSLNELAKCIQQMHIHDINAECKSFKNEPEELLHHKGSLKGDTVNKYSAAELQNKRRQQQ